MDEIDFKELIRIIERYTRRSYMAFEDSSGHDIPNVANLGGKISDIVKLERSGEYFGIAVELLEDLKPLLTDKFVTRILQMLQKEDYITPLVILSLSSMDQLYYILDQWFQVATVNYNFAFKPNSKYPVFDRWINTVTYDPLLGPIRVVEIGFNQNTGDSVVPDDWIGLEFSDGQSMQQAMTELPSRAGKPPVTFAIIYAMIIQKTDHLLTDISNVKYDRIFYLDLIGDSLQTTLVTHKRTDDTYSYLVYTDSLNAGTLIGFKVDEILEPKGNIDGEHKQSKIREVGLLVSRLQKAIRRGRYGSKALVETIESLNISPNYNLPEHGFLRVSAAKQLVWRLFVTIFEDCRSYYPVNMASLLDLSVLVLITQKMLEFKFTRPVLNNIKLIALLAQYNDTVNDWYPWYQIEPVIDAPIVPDSPYKNAIALVVNNVIMRGGDNEMLRKYYTLNQSDLTPYDTPFELIPENRAKVLTNNNYLFHKESVYKDIVLSSIDMHNKTHLILYYQACVPVSMTTKEIAGYIWNISSSYNVRSGQEHPEKDHILLEIQQYFYDEGQAAIQELTTENKIEFPSEQDFSEQQIDSYLDLDLSDQTRRTSFLLLFGTKYRSQGKEIVIAGSKENPARVKINNEWTYSSDVNLLNAFPRKTVDLNSLDPPFGYQWTRRKVEVAISNGKPTIDNTVVEYFDGSIVIESVTPKITNRISDQIYQLIVQILSASNIEFKTLLKLRQTRLSKLFDWQPKKSDLKQINMQLIQLTYTKIYNQFNNIIMIGPVSSSGSKMQNSINYLLEGKLWSVFNLLSFLYPDTFKPHGAVNFHIKKGTAGYIHAIESLKSILFAKEKITGPIPTITTELWDHQKDSASVVLAGFNRGYFGFGDSSDVGSGKTLTSLFIATELIRTTNNTYKGILVLLPGNKLIKTWSDELEKHTKGFDIVFQEHTNKIKPIDRNTIVVTTMGRNRDHPINNKWLLVIIDECLTVQNKNALWTEGAWRQSIVAKHLVMMSATFFRTRFDKLYYMLKMLRTGLPERREYLDAILIETIVSQVSKNKRKWTSRFNYFDLDNKHVENMTR